MPWLPGPPRASAGQRPRSSAGVAPAEVVVHGRNPARGSAGVGTITAEGGTARFVAADLSDPAELEDLAGHAGTVDVLVNNAGFSWFGADRGARRGDFRPAVRDQHPGGVLPGCRAGPEDGRPGKRQHHQAREHGRPDRLGRQRCLRRDRGDPSDDDPFLGRRVQSLRNPGQCHRCRAGPDQRRRPRPHRGPRRHDPAGPGRPARRDRQRDRLPDLAQGSHITGAVIAADGGRTAI